MEDPTPFDVNEAIHRWQQNLAASPAVCADNLEELASHLRASVQRLQATGLSEDEAFLVASRRLGAVDELDREFSKVNRGLVWRARAFWMLAGMLVYLGASDVSSLISNAIMALCSPYLANGFVLGWIGAATWVLVIVLAAFLFYLVAAGRCIGITSATARLLQRRKTAVAVLFCGAVALRAAATGGVMLLVRNLPPATAGQAFLVRNYSGVIGGLAILMVILVALTRPASGTSKTAINVQNDRPDNR